MAKAGWKKAKTLDHVDSKLMVEKSSSFETKNFFAALEPKPDLPTRRQRLDPLTEYLECKIYYSQMRWAWFRYEFLGNTYALEVSRYYPEKNLAIDIDPKDREHLDLKERLLADNNIKYIIINSAGDIASLGGGL